ncbi:MAG: DUF2130 domain-containing protein [Dinghuibacter sp.]|nr:DUF2130 domain-containing protein [Dinghuibacter sp.]
MANEIKCPNCGKYFEPEESIREEVKQQLRGEMADWKKKQEQQMATERAQLQQQLEETLRKNIAGDYENKLRLLEQEKQDNAEKLKLARDKELDFLKKQQELLNKEQELDIRLQTMLLEERNKLTETIRKEEASRVSLKETEFQMKLKEMEEKLEAQKKLAEEMKRKAEQGSMQLQGEVQELLLEELLRSGFPFDTISEVGKGVRGADCIQTVHNKLGQECGRIIFESKRTKHFDRGWIEKLKTDMRGTNSDVAVLVSLALPDDIKQFAQVDGVWVCTFEEVVALVHVLREGLVRVFNAVKSQENKGDKMHMLYDYLTSNEFAEQWQAIREGFMNMKVSIQRERDAMEKLWKAREKQLEKVLLNAAHIRGSVEGIAGMDSVNLQLLEDAEPGEE